MCFTHHYYTSKTYFGIDFEVTMLCQQFFLYISKENKKKTSLLSFSGVGSRGLDFISPSLSCINTKLTQIGEDFCGLDVNTPLGGELPVVQEPVLTFDSHLTAITATSTGDFTVAFIGKRKLRFLDFAKSLQSNNNEFYSLHNSKNVQTFLTIPFLYFHFRIRRRLPQKSSYRRIFLGG